MLHKKGHGMERSELQVDRVLEQDVFQFLARGCRACKVLRCLILRGVAIGKQVGN